MDKASVIREAQKYLAKGQIDKAIAEWEKLAEVSPESNVFNFIGDLYLKKGNKDAACGAYHKAASVFRNEGFALKALALYKKILNLNPADSNALYALGELNEEKSIPTDAIRYYLAAAELMSKANRRNDVLKTYEKVLHLAPANIPMRIKIAGMFSKEGFVTEAAREYLQAGNLYEEQGDMEKAREYVKKSMEIQPSNKGAPLALCRLFEKSGNYHQALQYAKLAMEKSGGEAGAVVSFARILVKTGAVSEALSHVSAALDKEPANAELGRMLADIYWKKGDKEKAWHQYMSVVDDMINAEKYGDAVGLLDKIKDFDPIDASRKLIFLFKTSGNDKSAFNELMALCGVYEGKGRTQEAIDCLKEASLLQPENPDMLARLGSLEMQLSSEKLESEAMDGSGGQPALQEAASAGAVSEPSMPEMSASESDIAQLPGADSTLQSDDFEQQIERPGAEGEKPVDELLTEANIFLRYGLHGEAKKLLESLKVREPGNIEVHQKLKTLYIDTGDREQAVTECLILSELHKRAGDEQSRQKFLGEAFEINPSDPRLAGRLDKEHPEPSPAEPSAVRSEPGPAGKGAALEDYGEDLSEAEFYIKQGFFKEAREIYVRLLGKFPADGGLKSKLGDVEERIKEGSAQAETSAGTADKGAETISMEDLLMTEAEPEDAQELKDPALDSEVLEIFEEFKKGLEKQVEAEDSETHYNLGIAYKEMGLMDDAINSFQMAQHDPNFFVRSAGMLGVCYMEKGLYSLAIDSFQSALMKTDKKEESAWSLKYDLAEAFERNGNGREALGLYTEVYGWNSKFKEVAEKINSLKTEEPRRPEPRTASGPMPGQTRPAPPRPAEPAGKAKDRKSRVSYI